MTSENSVFMSRDEIFSQILLRNTFPVGGVTMGAQNVSIFIVDLTEVPLGSSRAPGGIGERPFKLGRVARQIRSGSR